MAFRLVAKKVISLRLGAEDMPEYRGIEYVTRPRGPNKWQWELYEVGATIGFDKGEIAGTAKEAAACARNAIERLVAEPTQESGRKFSTAPNVGFIMHQLKRLERLAKRTRHVAERRVHEAAVAHLKKQLVDQGSK